MRGLRSIMGMPIRVEIVDSAATFDDMEKVFAHFISVDERFSTYKPESEIMRINRGTVQKGESSEEMQEVLALAEKTKRETNGYFDIQRADGNLDPSGVVKGWAILNAARILRTCGRENFYIDAGGDIQSNGYNMVGKPWSVGIRNPFNRDEIVKVVYPADKGIATSGTAVRGQHIYNPHMPSTPITDIVSITVIGPDICEADRFATAAFAMGRQGIVFIENLPGFEAYVIGADGIATMTSGFEAYQTV